MRKHVLLSTVCMFGILVLFMILSPVSVLAAKKPASLKYEFKSTDPDKEFYLESCMELIEYLDELNRKASKIKGYYEGDEIAPDVFMLVDEQKTFTYDTVVWSYHHISPDASFTATKVKNIITVYWEPEVKESKYYTVSFAYRYEPQNVQPSDEILEMFPVPEDVTCLGGTKIDLHQYNAELDAVEDHVNDGKWVPRGFLTVNDSETLTVNRNMTMERTWTFNGNPHEVEYRAVSSDPERPFPDELLNVIQPQGEKQYVSKGDWIQAEVPGVLEVPYGEGKWYFLGYDKDTLVGKADQSENYFLGTWVYAANSLKVRYRFESTDAEIDLPAKIMQFLPCDTGSYSPGELVIAVQPTVVYYQGTINNWNIYQECSWIFEGYDQNEQVAGQEDVVFVGRWRPDYLGRTVGCVFESLDESEKLPVMIQQDAPKPYFAGVDEAPEPTLKQYSYDVSDGRWDFDHFYYSKSAHNNRPEMYIGYWKYVEGLRKIRYTAVSTSAGKIVPDGVQELLPDDSTTNARNISFIPENPSALELSVEGGKWVFEGYQAIEILPGKTDLIYVSEWSFNQDGRILNVQYRSQTENESLPEMIQNAVPAPVYVKYPAGPANPDTNVYSVTDGQWVFDHFTHDEEQDTDISETYVGFWRFEEGSRKVRHTAVSVTEGKDVPGGVLELLPLDSTTNARNVSIKPQNPSALELAVDGGKWLFVGYQTVEIQPGTDDLVFVSEWKFEKAGREIIVQFQSMTENETLPEIIRKAVPAPVYVKYPAGPANPDTNVYSVTDGQWVFDHFTHDEEQDTDTSETYIGFWRFEEGTRKVRYTAVSVTEGKDVPDGVLELLPEDTTTNARNVSIKPQNPSVLELTIEGGKWLFVGYQTVEIQPGTDDLVFVSEWKFEKAGREIIVQFQSMTENETLPEIIRKAVPAPMYVKYPAGPANPDPNVYSVTDGQWVFDHYTHDEEQDTDTSETYVGFWRFEEGSRKVRHTAVSVTEGKDVPGGVLELLPLDSTTNARNVSIKPQNPSALELAVEGGKWLFGGYQTVEIQPGTDDLVFVSEWEFKKAGREIVVQFQSMTENETLPEIIRKAVPAPVYVKYPAGPANPDTNVYFVTDGQWVFDHFTHDEEQDTDTSETYVGFWKFEEGSRKVRYAAVSLTEGKDVPGSVLELLPEDTTTNARNVSIKPQNPSALELAVEGGKWLFGGYQTVEIQPGTDDLVFVSEWEFKKAGREIVVQFQSMTENETLPEIIRKAVPASVYVKYPAGPANPDPNVYIVTDGQWVFDHFTHDEEQDTDTSETYVGFWKFEEGSRKVRYAAVSLTEGKDVPGSVLELLPEDTTTNARNVSIKPQNPSALELAVEGGKWLFGGYQTVEIQPGTDDLVFVSEWKFERAGREIVVQFKSMTENESLPEIIRKAVPAPMYVKYPAGPANPDPNVYSVTDGQWVFDHFAHDEEQDTDTSETYVGFWKFEEGSRKVRYAAVSLTEGKDVSDSVLELLPEDTTTNARNVSIKPQNPSVLELTIEGGKWLFVGYQTVEIQPGTDDLVFVSEWRYEKAGREIVVQFQSMTENETLPEIIRKAVPAPIYVKYPAGPANPDPNVYSVTDGQWVFDHFAHDEEQDTDTSETYVGFWKFEEGSRKVRYAAVSLTEGKDVPGSVLELLPEDTTTNARNVSIKPQNPSALELAVEDGKWLFGGYQTVEIQPGTDDLVFVSEWKFERAGREIVVQFQSMTENETLPEIIRKAVPAPVYVKYPDGPKDPEPDIYAVNDGEWVFDHFTHDLSADTADTEHYTGYWRYGEGTREVVYSAASDTEGMAIPESILSLLPDNTTTGSRNVSFEPQKPSLTEQAVEGGKWVFDGYRPFEILSGKEQIEFVSVWHFVLDQKKIVILYESLTENETLPEHIQSSAPESYFADMKHEPEKPETDQYEVVDGVWNFEKYERTEDSVLLARFSDDENQGNSSEQTVEHYIGYWKFSEGTRAVRYTAVSGTAGKTLPTEILKLLPDETTTGARNTQFVPEQPAVNMLKVDGGKWTFDGYQQMDIQAGTDPVEFVSVWLYAPDLVTKVILTGKVELSRKEIAENMFEFVLLKDENVIETVSNRADGIFEFSGITFTSSDLENMSDEGYEYVIMQVDGGETIDGITLDDRRASVQIRLQEEDGRLVGTCGDIPVFKNAYKAAGSVSVLGSVEVYGLELVGKVLKEAGMQEFDFELFEEDGGDQVLLDRTTSDDSGQFSFQLDLQLSDAGIHTYVIKQCETGGRFLADVHAHRFILRVSDDGTGGLEVEPVYVGSVVAALQPIQVSFREIVFTNRIESESIVVEIDKTVGSIDGWQLFANGLPVSADDDVMAQVVTETDTYVRFRGLPSYDAMGNKIRWSVQPITSETIIIVTDDGEVKESPYVENGDCIRRPAKPAVNHTGVRFTVVLEWVGDDGNHKPDVKVQLLKNGKPSGHAMRSRRIDSRRTTYFAEDLGNGTYTAIANSVDGYSVQYIRADGSAGDSADNGGQILLIRIPDTGDSEQPLILYVGIFVAAVFLLAVLGITHGKRK